MNLIAVTVFLVRKKKEAPFQPSTVLRQDEQTG